MRHSKTTLAVIAVLAASLSVPALAHGNRPGQRSGAAPAARAHFGYPAPHRLFARGARIGVFVGVPLVAAPLFYPAPRVYYPPPVYIEQPPAQPYWYFCPEANAYYPYVQQCPGGWQQVLPQPPG
jgi:hypothetical protein